MQDALENGDMTDTNFPSRLRQTRKARGYTQWQLADALGVSVQAVSQWETGKSGASQERVQLLGQYLGVDWDWLGYGAEEAEEKIKQIYNIETKQDYQRATFCTRDELAEWISLNPELDREIWGVLDFETREAEESRDGEYLDPRFPPVGIMIATGIYSPSMEPEFKAGDCMLFDTGIRPMPGDKVLFHCKTNKKVFFREFGYTSDENSRMLIVLSPINNFYPKIYLGIDERDSVFATMVEHRRFRQRPSAETLRHWREISSDA